MAAEAKAKADAEAAEKAAAEAKAKAEAERERMVPSGSGSRFRGKAPHEAVADEKAAFGVVVCTQDGVPLGNNKACKVVAHLRTAKGVAVPGEWVRAM